MLATDRDVARDSGVWPAGKGSLCFRKPLRVCVNGRRLTYGLGGVGPSPGVGEGVGLCLACFAGGAFWGGPALARQSARDGFSARVRATMRSRRA